MLFNATRLPTNSQLRQLNCQLVLFLHWPHFTTLEIGDIITVIQQHRLRWYGHVLSKDENDCMKKMCAAVWLTPTTRVLCSNAAKTRNPLKLPGVPQTNETISAASAPSSPYCEDMWRRYCCLTSFFPIVDMCLSYEDIAR